MGNTSTNAYLAYGIQLEDGSLASMGGWNKPEGSPSNLAYTGNENNGIKILRHCSSEFPEFIVCLASSVHLATRGYPQVIPADLMSGSSDSRIMDYCKEHGLKTVGEPSWLLFSYWG